MLLNTWQLNIVLYYIFVVIFFQSYKLSVKQVRHDSAATILLQCIGGISILVLVPFFPLQRPALLGPFLLLIVSCVFYAISDRLQMTARKNLEVSTFSIINQLSTVFVIIFGFTLFKEPLLITKLLGAAFIIAANVLILYQAGEHTFNINKYTVMAMSATLAFATAISIDIDISKQFNLPIYISLTLLVPALMIGLAGRVKPSEPFRELKRGSLKLFLLTGLTFGLTIFFSLRAFRLGKVDTVITLEAGAVVLNVLVAYIFLKERDAPYRKIFGAFLVLIGVLLTTH